MIDFPRKQNDSRHLFWCFSERRGLVEDNQKRKNKKIDVKEKFGSKNKVRHWNYAFEIFNVLLMFLLSLSLSRACTVLWIFHNANKITALAECFQYLSFVCVRVSMKIA